MCNVIIVHAAVYLNDDHHNINCIHDGNDEKEKRMGETSEKKIQFLLSSTDEIQINKLIIKLETIINKIELLKSIYLIYKDRSQFECCDRQWKVSTSSVFMKIDLYLQRCHDIINYSQSCLLFINASKVQIGGCVGDLLTTSLRRLSDEFIESVHFVRDVGKGVMDLDNKEFESAFYEYRSTMKILDQRITRLVVRGFDETNSAHAAFKFLNSFNKFFFCRPLVVSKLTEKYSGAYLIPMDNRIIVSDKNILVTLFEMNIFMPFS